jgi:DNA invertase Pin-like site-specific DNA recombinase
MKIRAYAQRMNLEIVGEFVDEGCSGLRQNRPQLQNALKLIARHKCHVLVVSDLTHLSRSWQQIPDLLQILQQHDVMVISLAEPEIEYEVTLLKRLFTTHSYTANPKRIRQKYCHKTRYLPG